MATALITGGNRGLGLAVAHMLLQRKNEVILTARNADKLESSTTLLKNQYGNNMVHGILCDVSNIESVQLLKARLSESFGKVDLLINNAGIIPNGDGFPDAKLEDIFNTLETNLYGPYRVSQACLSLLTQSDNAMIINVSSGMGAHNEQGTGYTAYRLSKFALNGLTDIMHRELNNYNIKVVSVCPGWVHTDLGGPNAPRTPEQGAKSILFPFFQQMESGKFYRNGKVIGW